VPVAPATTPTATGSAAGNSGTTAEDCQGLG
jgi:hypothetical protein